MKKKKILVKKGRSKKLKKFKIGKLYKLIGVIERRKEFVFIVGAEDLTIDVLDYDSEDGVDGGCFASIPEIYDFVKYYYG